MPMHLIYIAGPYRGADRIAITSNIANARAVAVQAAAQGWFPVCPHLNTAHMEEQLDHPDDFWLAGTLAEVARAKQLGIPIFTNHKFLIEADEFRAAAETEEFA